MPTVVALVLHDFEPGFSKARFARPRRGHHAQKVSPGVANAQPKLRRGIPIPVEPDGVRVDDLVLPVSTSGNMLTKLKHPGCRLLTARDRDIAGLDLVAASESLPADSFQNRRPATPLRLAWNDREEQMPGLPGIPELHARRIPPRRKVGPDLEHGQPPKQPFRVFLHDLANRGAVRGSQGPRPEVFRQPVDPEHSAPAEGIDDAFGPDLHRVRATRDRQNILLEIQRISVQREMA